MNEIRDLELFVDDVYSEIKARFEQTQKEMFDSKSDDFISGRALAYHEVLEIIQSRMKTYNISPSKD